MAETMDSASRIGVEVSCGTDDKTPDSHPEATSSSNIMPSQANVVETVAETEGQQHVVIALQEHGSTAGGTQPVQALSKETFVELGHTEAEAETISQIFIEVCSAESMGLFSAGQGGVEAVGTEAVSYERWKNSQDAGIKLLRDQSVQANDYEIERSGRLPARRRVIPHKFRDYKNPDSEDENDDSDYDPETELQPAKKQRGVGRGRGKAVSEESDGEVKLGQRGRGRGRRGRGRGVRRGNSFPCDQCDRVFSQKGNLTVHLRIHRDERPFSCDMDGCIKAFRTNETLRRHKLSHLGVKPFECEICQKRFSCNVSLKEHLSIHSDDKPYKCEKCERSFRHISTLSRHMTTHTDATPHRCAECGKQFAQIAYLRSHLRVHTGEKPYVCDQCGRRFAHQSDVIRHKIIHTGLKPFACEVCNAKFSDPSSRRRHVKEHVGRKPFPCEICGDQFKRAGQLKVHLGRVHNSYTMPADKTTIQQLYKDFSKTGSEASEQEKIARLISSLSSAGSVQQLTVLAPPHASGFPNQGEVQISSDMPEAECEQILIEAAQAGEVTVQTMGEFIVTSLPEAEEVTSPVCVPISAAQTEQEVSFGPDTSTEETVHSVGEEDSSQTGVLSQSESTSVARNDGQCKEAPVEYMYEIIEEGLEDTTTEQVVEVQCQPESHSSEALVQDEVSTVSDTESKQEEEKAGSETSEGDSAVDYVKNPDFASQGYYNWLSNFTELCKLVPMPLDVDLFQKISQVHKTLSDVMATPSGIVSIKENYKILMSITKDLNIIINEHLAFVLENLENTKESS